MDPHCIQTLVNALHGVLVSISLGQLITTTATVRKKRIVRSRIPSNGPPPPPSLPVSSETNEPYFENTTKKPYMPTIAVSQSLWKLIGGPDWETDFGISTPEKRPLGTTARLAARFLCKPDNDGAVGGVRGLLRETISIADDCLTKTSGPAGRFFAPYVVRELQLVQSLEGEIRVGVGGELCEGVLLSYDIQTLGDEEYEYTLHIHVKDPVDGLPVIQHFVKSREWFRDSCGISFGHRLGPE